MIITSRSVLARFNGQISDACQCPQSVTDGGSRLMPFRGFAAGFLIGKYHIFENIKISKISKISF